MSAPAVSAQSAIDAYLQSALADSDAFGTLSDLLLTESDSDMAGVLSAIEGAGGTDNPAIYWALQMALADRFGTPNPVIADQTTAQQAQDIYNQYGDGLRDYVDAVHTATQQYFGDYGVSEITAYHGLNYPQAPDDMHFDMAARNANMALSGITVYSQDPASIITAALASQNGLTPNLAHIIASQQLPISDLWGIMPDGSLRVLPSASNQPSLYVGWEADSANDTWTPDPSIVSGLLEPLPDALGGESGAPPPPSAPEQPGTPESPPGDIYQQTWDYRQQLLEGVNSAQQTMNDFYGPALEQINAQMMALAKKIYDAQSNGEEVDPMWLARETSLAQLYVDIEDRMNQAAQQASDALAQQMMGAANLGVATGNAQLGSLIPNYNQLLQAAKVDTLFGQPSEQALQNMVGAGQDPNSPLNMAFGALGQAAIDLIKHGLFNGLALGQNPLTVASDLAGQVEDMTLSRANAIARNEMLRSYRTANLMSYQENSDVVDGWVWVAALSTNTCAFCWAENGGFHSSDETLDSHVSCACTMVPVTGDWSSVLSDLEEAGLDESDLEEMGIDFSEIEDTTVQVPRGEDIFAKQPPDVQEKVLGPGKYALYQNGDITLQDLVGHYHDEQWGGVGYEKSLKDLGFTPDDVQAAKDALAAHEALGETPTVRPPEKTPTQIAQEAGDRVRAAEEEARQAIEAAKTPPTTILGKIKAWADIHFKLSQADQAWRAEIDAIDQRLLAQRIAQQKLERGAGPLTPEVEAAAKRLLEERYRQAKVERGVNPLTDEVRQIEQRQREQREQRRTDHGPSFAAKSQASGTSGSLAVKKFETYMLTPEDKAFAASIREQIGPEGVLDHQQAIEIGRQIQERIADQTSQTAGWAQETADIRTSLPDLTDEQKAWINGDKAAMEAHGGVDFYSAPDAYQADYRAKTVAYLAEIRGDTGGLGGVQPEFSIYDERFDVTTAQAIRDAAALLPSDWIKASNAYGDISPIRSRATNSGGWFEPTGEGKADIALSYNKQSNPLDLQTMALHELIHRMETAVPQLGQLEREFYSERTAGEAYTKLDNGIAGRTKIDQWLDPYLGKQPEGLLRPNYELLSNGVQMAMGHTAEAGMFAQDREFERFVLGSLAGVKARPGEIPLAEGETGPARAARNPAPFHQVEEEQGQRSFAAKKGPEEAPRLDIERVNVSPVKPPRVRTLTAEQQAKRDVADAIKAAKAATTITKRGEALEISQGDMTARVEPDPNLGGYRLTLDGQTTEGATLARVNQLLKERLGYPGAVKADMIEAGPPRTAAEKKAYRESGVKNATTVEKIGEQPLPPGHLIDYADVAAFTAQNAPDIPPLLYHVTNERGERNLLRTGPNFDADQGRLADQGRGFYMTPLPFEPYMVYGNDRAVTVAAAIKNPWRFEAQDFRDLKTQLQRDYGDGWEEELQKRIRSGGHDALVVYPNFDFQREYGWTFIIAQDPSQVRFVTDAPETPPAVDRAALEKPKVKAALQEHEKQIAALRDAGQATGGGAQGLRFTRPDGQVVTVERDMVNGGYKVMINGETTEGLTIAKANALLKPFLGYNAPLAKEDLAPGPKAKPAVQKAQTALTKAQQQLDTIRQAWEEKNPPSIDQRGRPVYRFITPEIFDAQITVAKAQAKLDALQGGRGAAVVVRQTIEPFATEPLAQAMDGLFGRALSSDELAALVGAPKGSLVVLLPHGEGKSAGISIELHGPSWTPQNYHAQAEYTADRLLTWSDNGKYLVMNNTNFGVEARGQGIGIRIFSDEVNALAALGVRQIVTNAAGTGSFGEPDYEASANGYYTWPRFGYTGHIPETSLEYLQEQVADGTVPAKWGKYTTIQQLMATPEGRAWWKTYGSEIDGLVFDLREGSLSRRVLDAYLKDKGMNNG